jgi:hypothetical protein
MQTFAEFESKFLSALQQERSELQGLQGASEAQLSAWVEHLFRDYLGYTHFKEITREGSAPIGSKGSKQLFPDLRINVLDNGIIFVECKRLGRLDGTKGQEELNDAKSQLMSYIRAHVDQTSTRLKTVLGVVTDGNHWLLLGLNRNNEFHTIAEWKFLTDDPRLISQRMWLLAKPALAQPTSAVVEFLARRTLADVLKENAKWLTRKVNEKLPEGVVSEELVAKWLRDVYSDAAILPRSTTGESPQISAAKQPSSSLTNQTSSPIPPEGQLERAELQITPDGIEPVAETRRIQIQVALPDIIAAGLLQPPLLLFCDYKGQRLEAKLLPDGKVEFQNATYDTCSGAGEVAKGTVTGKRMNTNGWDFWQYIDATGNTHTLDDARKKFQEMKGAT